MDAQIAEEMVDARPSTVGKGAVEETVDIKAWWLVLYLRPVSMSPRVAAPVVGGQVVSSICYRGCNRVVRVRARRRWCRPGVYHPKAPSSLRVEQDRSEVFLNAVTRTPPSQKGGVIL